MTIIKILFIIISVETISSNITDEIEIHLDEKQVQNVPNVTVEIIISNSTYNRDVNFVDSTINAFQSNNINVKSIYSFKLKKNLPKLINLNNINLHVRFLCSIDQAVYVDTIKLTGKFKNGTNYDISFCPSDLNNKCHCRGYKWFTANCSH